VVQGYSQLDALQQGKPSPKISQWHFHPATCLQGSEREYIIVSFVRSTSQDEDVVTSVAKTAGDSVALQEPGRGAMLMFVGCP